MCGDYGTGLSDMDLLLIGDVPDDLGDLGAGMICHRLVAVDRVELIDHDLPADSGILVCHGSSIRYGVLK